MGSWKRWTLPVLLLILCSCAGCAPSEAEEIVEIGVGEIQAAREGPGGGAGRGAGGEIPAEGGERPQAAAASSGMAQDSPGASSDGRAQAARQQEHDSQKHDPDKSQPPCSCIVQIYHRRNIRASF